MTMKKRWDSVARRMEAACVGNKGYAILNIKIVVRKNTPVLWAGISLNQVEPVSLTKFNQDDGVLALVGLLCKEPEITDEKKDNTKEESAV